MTKFLNLKILVENNLDEIISTLESKGYRCDGYHPYYCNYIVCCDDGTYCMYTLDIGRDDEYILTSLVELKEIVK